MFSFRLLLTRHCANLGNGEDRVINIRLDLKRIIPLSWLKKLGFIVEVNSEFILLFLKKLNFNF